MSPAFWLRWERCGVSWRFRWVPSERIGLKERFAAIGGHEGSLPAERLEANFHTAAQYRMYCVSPSWR